MPHDVIMPALGMAQETGVIVAWHKHPGDAVAEGDVLFEVETDKATMEVEAQGAGFLSGVTAGEGDEVPVGNVIARITDNAEDDAPPAAPAAQDAAADSPTSDLPEGQQIIMPTLGMAQDSGLLVGWLAEPGAKVGADDPLFEVETDKSTMEVPAGAEGYLAACLAQPGDDVPTGQVIAILTAEAPSETVVRGMSEAPAAAPADVAAAPVAEDPSPAPEKTKPAATSRPVADPSGRILASPKARRLAREQGLDLGCLAAAGVPQPYHAKDIETLKSLPAEPVAASGVAAVGGMHLTAEIPADGFSSFAEWAADSSGLSDSAALLAGLAGASIDKTPACVALEAFGQRRYFEVPAGPLGSVSEIEDGAPDVILRDLRMTRITGIRLGADAAPVLSLTSTGAGLALTLEADPGQISQSAALTLLSDFAGRLEQPLRHLL